MHGGKSFTGVDDVGAQGDIHEPHHVATGGAFLGRAHINWTACNQRVFWQFALALQVLAHAPGDDGQHDIVYCSAGLRILDCPYLFEVKLARLNHAVP